METCTNSQTSKDSLWLVREARACSCNASARVPWSTRTCQHPESKGPVGRAGSDKAVTWINPGQVLQAHRTAGVRPNGTRNQSPNSKRFPSWMACNKFALARDLKHAVRWCAGGPASAHRSQERALSRNRPDTSPSNTYTWADPRN
jgi:hypothetical protein